MLLWLRSRLSNLGPNWDAHNERIKLIAFTLNAAGIASLVGGLLGPLFDAPRQLQLPLALIGALVWLVCLVAEYQILGYTRGKED